MFDELDRLREDERLCRLLNQYAQGNVLDRELWQDRLMQLDGVRTEELVKLHGELLAYDWLEQNTGITPIAQVGLARQFYRVTAAGRRAVKLAHSSRDEDDALAA